MPTYRIFLQGYVDVDYPAADEASMTQLHTQSAILAALYAKSVSLDDLQGLRLSICPRTIAEDEEARTNAAQGRKALQIGPRLRAQRRRQEPI